MNELTERGLNALIKDTKKSLTLIDNASTPKGEYWCKEKQVSTLDELTVVMEKNGYLVYPETKEDMSIIYKEIIKLKPSLKLKHYHKEALEYAGKLKSYEKLLKEKDEIKSLEKSIQIKNKDTIYEWMKSHLDFDSVPKEYQEKVWLLALQRGHGLSDVEYELDSLIELFN